MSLLLWTLPNGNEYPVVAASKVKEYTVCRPTQDKVKVSRRATNKKSKTDRIDATTFARRLFNGLPERSPNLSTK